MTSEIEWIVPMWQGIPWEDNFLYDISQTIQAESEAKPQSMALYMHLSCVSHIGILCRILMFKQYTILLWVVTLLWEKYPGFIWHSCTAVHFIILYADSIWQKVDDQQSGFVEITLNYKLQESTKVVFTCLKINLWRHFVWPASNWLWGRGNCLTNCLRNCPDCLMIWK